jgi:NAD(P)-dependent dehydrogenase (short-subunit alcohol dehydrogenase family)
MLQSTNKPVVCIAGATGSIGLAGAKALVKRGARVVLLGRDADRLDAKARIVRESANGVAADDVQTLVIDFSDVAAVERAAREALRRFPAIDGLVLSIGALLHGGPKVLPSGHEAMFATNVLGPFVFTEMLMERLAQSNGIVLHVIAMFYKPIDWNNLESIDKHKTSLAFNRTKTLNRVIAAETARRYAGRVASVAFDPTFVIDKTDPDLAKRWPPGLTGVFWTVLTRLFAKDPRIAGEPLASLVLDTERRASMNGALFRLDKRIDKIDRAMSDTEMGERLWDALESMSTPAEGTAAGTAAGGR